MADAPTFVAAGLADHGDGAVTPGLPAGLSENDIMLIVGETGDSDTFDPTSVLSAWTTVTGTPVSTTGTKLWALWKRAAVSESAPTLADAGDHQIAVILAVRGCPFTGTPWDGTPQTSTESTSDTSGSATGYTTTVHDTLVFILAATDLPASNSSASFSAWTNANLESLVERVDEATNGGAGGSLGIATGVKATAGAIGATTYTKSVASTKAHLVIAFKENTHVAATSVATLTAKYTSVSSVG